ncbi:MAG: hypothetical protein DU429_03700 [Candidatus Tokpelaia sp.]|nr:MAG: hypothetical protein DU430_01565 [Candidatus Tokpelaia sp.]KAA6207203.1 MAG: hypothetical protein DU429_03700 [Candidatus Tokpelaia sp.]KAA6406242.1 hypothetical protein DPQ22_00565 [Candidatus Tokpelaia sp.]
MVIAGLCRAGGDVFQTACPIKNSKRRALVPLLFVWGFLFLPEPGKIPAACRLALAFLPYFATVLAQVFFFSCFLQ